MRGDVRLTFIENYVLWITKESEGMQKLDREVRGIFGVICHLVLNAVKISKIVALYTINFISMIKIALELLILLIPISHDIFEE